MFTWLRNSLRDPNPTPSYKAAFRAQLTLENMESRIVPAALTDKLVAIASYNGYTDSTVNLYDPATSYPAFASITPFPGYKGALSVAAGDVNGDGISDLVVAAQGAGGHVKVFDGVTGNLIDNFFAFPGFLGGVNVGAADVNGDGYQDILVAADYNAHIRAFSGKDGSVVSSFLAFPGFLGPISVSGADFNGGSADQIIVGAGGPNINGRVALFNADGSMYNSGFFAFPGFDGEISVAGGDITGSGVADIVVSSGAGAPGGAVKAFSGTDFSVIDSFLAYNPAYTDGVDVRVADATGSGIRDIIVTTHGGSLQDIQVFDGKTGQLITQTPSGSGTNYPDPPTGNVGGNDNGSGGDNSNSGVYTGGDTSGGVTDSGGYTGGDTGGGSDTGGDSGGSTDSGGGDSGGDDSGGDDGGDFSPDFLFAVKLK